MNRRALFLAPLGLLFGRSLQPKVPAGVSGSINGVAGGFVAFTVNDIVYAASLPAEVKRRATAAIELARNII